MALKSRRRSSTWTFTPTWALGLNSTPFGLHLFQTAVDQMLLHLEIGDAVAEQAADAVGFLEDGDPVAGAAELLRGGEAGGSGADYRDAFAGADCGRLGMDPAFVKGAVDDGSSRST